MENGKRQWGKSLHCEGSWEKSESRLKERGGEGNE